MDQTTNLSCPEVENSFSPFQLGTTSHSASSYPSSPSNRITEYDILGKTGRTVREYDKELEDLRKENFSLKLRIYLLEQRFAASVGRDVAETVQNNVQLQIQLQKLQDEMQCKDRVVEETRKIAQQNELAYRKAKEKIAALEKEIKSLKEDTSDFMTFSTPVRTKPKTAEEAFKEKYGLHTPNESWALETTSASVRFSDGEVDDTDELRSKISELERNLIAKELEIEQSKATIRQLRENNDALQVHSKKKSRVIQSLVFKLGKLPGTCNKEMLEAVNKGLEAARNKNIAEVHHYVNKVRQHFCELVSMDPGDLFQEHSANAAEPTDSCVVKDKRIQGRQQVPSSQLLHKSEPRSATCSKKLAFDVKKKLFL